MVLDDSEDEPLELPADVAPPRFEAISAAIDRSTIRNAVRLFPSANP